MSLLLNQPSKLCFRKPVLVRSSPLHSDGFSSSSLAAQTLPCAIVCADPCRPNLVTVVIRREGDFRPFERKMPMDLVERMGMIGSSNGWRATMDKGVVRLREHPAPSLEGRDLKSIELPPIVTLPLCQTQMVTNVAMSSSSPEDIDCVVAVKFFGPQLSFCRHPGRSNSEWISIRIPNPCFFSSRVMFSKKDDMFRILGSGGHLIGSWDLSWIMNNGFYLREHVLKHNDKFQRLRFKNIPKLTKTKRELLDSCYTSEHLVESTTTGETFMVKWYKKTIAKTIDHIERLETKALMVFKLDEEGNAVYTQDIGDLVIFLTKSEPLCVPASSFRDMRPNSVKILDVDETTVVDLPAQNWN